MKNTFADAQLFGGGALNKGQGTPSTGTIMATLS